MSKVSKKSRVVKVIKKLLLLSGRYLSFVRRVVAVNRLLDDRWVRVNLPVRNSRAHDAHDLRIRRTSELTATFVSRRLRQRGNWSQTAGNTGYNLVVVGPTAEQSEPPTERTLRYHPSAQRYHVGKHKSQCLPYGVRVYIYIIYIYRIPTQTQTQYYYYYYYYCQKTEMQFFSFVFN